MGTTKPSGRPQVTARNRVALFSDPVREAQLGELVMQTQRTALIEELMGLGPEVKTGRLKSHITRLLNEVGVKIILPRGIGRSPESRSFLATKAERLDGAMLIAIHFGSRGPGEFSEADTSMVTALNKLLESYYRYKAEMHAHSEPVHDFESWVALIRGIRSRVIEVHHCRDCGAMHPARADDLAEPSCPVCSHLNLDMDLVRKHVQERVEQRRAERLQVKPSQLRA